MALVYSNLVTLLLELTRETVDECLPSDQTNRISRYASKISFRSK